jgi:hypothetical protein
MSIKSVLTAAIFKQDEAGRTIMYPNGAMGRGYVVPDAATAEKMRSFLMWLIIGCGLVGGIGMRLLTMWCGQIEDWTALPWTIAASALVAIGITYRMLIARRLVRGLVPAEERMGMTEALRRQAAAMPRWYLMVMLVFGGALAITSGYWIIAGASVGQHIAGLGGSILFGAIVAQAIWGLRQKRTTA